MDLSIAIAQATDEVVSSGLITAHIKETIEKTVKSIITEQLREHSPFGKQVRDAIAKALQVEQSISIPAYNELVVRLIQEQVKGAAEDAIRKQVVDRVSAFIGEAPESVTLEELANGYVKHCKGRDFGGTYFGDSNEREVIVYIRTSDSVARTYQYIEMQRVGKDGKDTSEDSATVGVTPEGKIFHLSFGRVANENELLAGEGYGFFRLLYLMRANRTAINLGDRREFRLSYCLED